MAFGAFAVVPTLPMLRAIHIIAGVPLFEKTMTGDDDRGGDDTAETDLRSIQNCGISLFKPACS